MVLVFLLGFFIIINLIIFLILQSSVKLEVTKLHISNNEPKGLKMIFEIKLGIYLFNKINVFNTTIVEDKIKNLYKSSKIEIIRIEDRRLIKEIIKSLKRVEFKIEEFKLSGYIGTENAALTAILATFFSIITSIIISKKIKTYKKEKYKYEVKPIYINQNIVNLDVNCIISIKMVHIINIIYILFKKGRVKKNERTSNRRSYAYSNE